MPRFLTRSLFLSLSLLLLGSIFPPQRICADEITLKDGTKLTGRSTPLMGMGVGPKGTKRRGPTNVYSIMMVDMGLARYFVPRTQVADLVHDQMGAQADTFKIIQRGRGGPIAIQTIGSFGDIQPFDEFGRRQLTITSGGKKRVVIQGITEITPDYMRLEALGYTWESAIATTSIPKQTLIAILDKATKEDDRDHRMALARFYLQTHMYREAQNELANIQRKFPDAAENVAAFRLELTQLQARQILNELKLRRGAGQHQLVYESTRKFPTKDVSRSILRDVTDITKDYENKKRQAESFISKVTDFIASLKDEQQADQARVIFEKIKPELNFSSMPRLESYFLYAGDGGLPGEELLALALSGWVVGSTNADTNLNRAFEVWKAREIVLDYLGTSEAEVARRPELVRELENLEGIDAATIAQMLPLLPSALETPEAVIGDPFTVTVSDEGEEPTVAYTAVLPPEYHVGRNYPLIVSLRDRGMTTDQEAQWWAGNSEQQGQAQRHGYIVIAPDYTDEDALAHNYGSDSHHIVIECLRDACRRFQVDSDRVYLSGHGIGGDAAFDIGFSHPDLFAGVMPICGVIRHNVPHYWSNAEFLPLYVVGGQLDRHTSDENSGYLERMAVQGYGLIYAEYIGRGRESYYEEIHKLFDWMSKHTRNRTIREFEMNTLRQTDNRFFWYEAGGIPEKATVTNWTDPRATRRKRAIPLRIQISQGNTISIMSRSPERHTVWITPDLVDFDERLVVRLGNRRVYNEFMQADLATMLEDHRRRGDRQLIFWNRLDF